MLIPLVALCLSILIRIGSCQLALSEASDARVRAASWLTSQWIEPRNGVPASQTGGWDGAEGSTARILTGLQLADNGWIFNGANQPKPALAVRQMNAEILNALLRSGNMTTLAGGEGSEYVNALLATCQNPYNFYGHNLIAMLTRRLSTVPAGPTTKNVAQIISGVIALCTAKAPVIPAQLIQRINNELKPTSGGCPYCVEGASLAILAMKCLRDRPGPADPLVQGIMIRQIAYVKGKQEADGGFGNLFSTTLAVQAANAVGTVNLPINVASALSYILQDQDKTTGSFGNPFLTAFVLPTLIGRSALDSNAVPCPAARSLDDPPQTGRIRLILAIEDQIFAQQSTQTKLETAAGQTVLQIMNNQSAKHPRSFKFSTAVAAGNGGGTILTGVNGLDNDNKNNWNWRVLRLPAGTPNSPPQALTSLDRPVQLQTGDTIILRFGGA